VTAAAARLRAVVDLGSAFDLAALEAAPEEAFALAREVADIDRYRGWWPIATGWDLDHFPEWLLDPGPPWAEVDAASGPRPLLLVTFDPAGLARDGDRVGAAFGRLNRARNRLFRQGGVLVVAGDSAVLDAFVGAAPDTWSVRAAELR
jgi:hypothetical protein